DLTGVSAGPHHSRLCGQAARRAGRGRGARISPLCLKPRRPAGVDRGERISAAWAARDRGPAREARMRSLAASLLSASCAAAGGAEEQYRPLAPVRGVIRVWGNQTMAGIVRRWADGFARHHPGARIEARMIGGDVAIGALATGKADIALLGREAAPQ